MQDNLELKKQMILNALAATIKELRGSQSQFMLGSENDISTSIINTCERGLKDPQLTTVFRLAEAFGLDIIEFCKLIKSKLPDDFSMIEI